jgi:hypothetical protein
LRGTRARPRPRFDWHRSGALPLTTPDRAGEAAKSGHVVVAAGAHCAMVGWILAGIDEAQGEVILFQGRSFKSHRGV